MGEFVYLRSEILTNRKMELDDVVGTSKCLRLQAVVIQSIIICAAIHLLPDSLFNERLFSHHARMYTCYHRPLLPVAIFSPARSVSCLTPVSCVSCHVCLLCHGCRLPGAPSTSAVSCLTCPLPCLSPVMVVSWLDESPQAVALCSYLNNSPP